jgi:hypothetical protein
MKKKEVVESFFGWLLASAQVASDGLASARQIGDFTSSPLAKYAACGATIVEGEIYRKNIVEGFSRFNLLNRKSLWEYLIIEKFEENLASLNQFEKEIKKNLYDFLIDINEKYKLNEFDKDESEFLNKYKGFLENENYFLDAKDQEEIEKFFYNFKARRNGTSSYVELDDEDRFLNFKKNIKKLVFLKKNSFVASYLVNQQLFKETKLRHDKESIKEAEGQLKILRKMVIKSVIEEGSCDLLNNEENLSADFINKLKEEVSKKATKLWPLRFGMLFSIGVGVCIGVITFYTFPAVLIGFGLTSLTILSAVIWPLAILAAISYAILIYNTITDLILNETLSKWWKELNREIDQNYGQLNILKYICLVIGKSLSQFFGKLLNCFKLHENESYFSYTLRMVLSAAVLVFGIIAALTTGYTAFIQLQNYVSLSVCVITALPLMLSDLLFTLKNSFETVGLLTGISINNLLNPIKKSYQNFKDQVSAENCLQCLLQLLRIPLKVMLSVLKILIFGFHVFFTSVASDRFFNFPCWLTVFFAAGSELLTDICPLFGSKQDEHHDHDHGGIFNWIGKIIFIIPATILGILNYLFSQLNYIGSNANNKVLNLWEAIKQEWRQFDIMHVHEHLVDDESSLNETNRKLSKEVVFQKAIHICDKQINRLSKVFFKSDLAKEKIAIFEVCKKNLSENNPNNNITLESKAKKTLGKHRFFKRETTESMRKMDKIRILIGDYVVNDNNHTSNNNINRMTL